MEEYFKPARNIIFKRYMFGICKQDEGEPIDAFVTKLREKAASYGQLREDLIRDRLVLGVSDDSSIQKSESHSAEVIACRDVETHPC